MIDGADVSTLPNDRGNASRRDIPPSERPMALIIP